MFDAGDTYLSLPWWVPFRISIALFLGIVVGRWIGGLLGYAPYYPEWTTNWVGACDQMDRIWTQRRFVKYGAQDQARSRMAKMNGHRKAQ